MLGNSRRFKLSVRALRQKLGPGHWCF